MNAAQAHRRVIAAGSQPLCGYPRIEGGLGRSQHEASLLGAGLRAFIFGERAGLDVHGKALDSPYFWLPDLANSPTLHLPDDSLAA